MPASAGSMINRPMAISVQSCPGNGGLSPNRVPPSLNSSIRPSASSRVPMPSRASSRDGIPAGLCVLRMALPGYWSSKTLISEAQPEKPLFPLAGHMAVP